VAALTGKELQKEVLLPGTASTALEVVEEWL